MEDTSEREGDTPEEQGGLCREEKQSVQGHIAIKGTRNGLLLTLEPETPFSELLMALSERLAEAPSFFPRCFTCSGYQSAHASWK